MVSVWILCLTLVTSSGISVHSIPGFLTKISCEVAGKFWAEDVFDNTQKSSRYIPSHVIKFYTCLSTEEKGS